MNLFTRFIFVIFSIIFMAALNIGASYILPFPYSKINIIFVILTIVMMWSDSGMIIWISFFSHFFVELFSTTPFGLILFSTTLTWLFCYWLYRNFFTNRSWYSAGALTFFALIFYRFFYISAIFFIHISKKIETVSWQQIFTIISYEILFSTILTLILYIILSRFTKKLSNSTIEKGIFRI